MSGLASLRKVLLFGLLGAAGCLMGWLVGEPFLWLALPASQEESASLAARPVLAPPPSRPAPPAPPPPPLAGSAMLSAAPAPPPPTLAASRAGVVVPAAAAPELAIVRPKAPPPPPTEFAQRLEQARAKSGEVQLTLIWSNVNDLDLHCIDPAGEEVFFGNRRVRSGGELDVDQNAREPFTTTPVENIYWPQGKAPSGNYKVYVNHFANHGGRDPTSYKVSILVGGVRKEFAGRISSRDPKRLIHEFEVMPADSLGLAVSPELIVERGSSNQLKVRLARTTGAEPVVAKLAGDLGGLTPREFTFAAGVTEATVAIAVDASAAIGERVLAVRATAGTLTADTSFRLIVKQATPQLRLAVSPELIVNQGGSNRLRLRVARATDTGPIQIGFAGDLAGLAPKPLVLAAGETEATAEIEADASARAGERTITVLASADGLKADASFRLTVKEAPPDLRVAVSPELIIHPGGVNQIGFRVARSNSATPVLLSLDDQGQVLSPHTFLVRAHESDTVATVQLDAAAPLGERTVTVTATAGALQARTRFLLTIPEAPPLLRLALPSELRLNQRGANQLPVRIARDRCSGPILIRLQGAPAGVSPLEFTIPADRDEHEFTLTAVGAETGTTEIVVQAQGDGVDAEEPFTLIVAAGGPRWSWRVIVVIGLWTTLLAGGLALALVVGQNAYLERAWLTPGEFALVLGGSLTAGLLAGGIGQTLYSLLNLIRIWPQIGFLAGWVLLGGLVGRGVVFFVPNLSAWRATAAGSVGGFFGALAFIAVSFFGNVAGRCVGAAILGFAIGLMVALVETAFRKVWLEVRSGRRSLRTVNLGATPVVVGGDARKCTVVVSGAPGMALRFSERAGQIYCLDVLAEKTFPVTPGYRHRLRDVELVVCASDTRGSTPPTPRANASKPASTKPTPARKAVPVARSAAPVPPKPMPAPAATAPCPICGQTATGIPGNRRCAHCFSMF